MRPNRIEKFKMFNDSIRALRIKHAAAFSRGDGKAMRKIDSEIRKLRGRIAALPRAFDQPKKLGVKYQPQFYRA